MKSKRKVNIFTSRFKTRPNYARKKHRVDKKNKILTLYDRPIPLFLVGAYV